MFAQHFLRRLAVFALIIFLGIVSVYFTNKYYETNGTSPISTENSALFSTFSTDNQ